MGHRSFSLLLLHQDICYVTLGTISAVVRWVEESCPSLPTALPRLLALQSNAVRHALHTAITCVVGLPPSGLRSDSAGLHLLCLLSPLISSFWSNLVSTSPSADCRWRPGPSSHQTSFNSLCTAYSRPCRALTGRSAISSRHRTLGAIESCDSASAAHSNSLSCCAPEVDQTSRALSF